MDELNLTLLSRTVRGRFDRKGAQRTRLALFEAPERYTLTSSPQAPAVGEIQLQFRSGEQFLLHSLELRTPDGRHLYRWAGAGELFRQSQGLRLSRHEGVVKVECVGEAPALTMTLDPETAGEAVQLLLTLASTGALTQPAERTPDLVGAALNQLQAKIADSAEETARLVEARLATQQEALGTLDRGLGELGSRLDQARAEANQQHNALVDLFNRRLGELTQRAEVELAQARHLISAQASRIGELERSTSWRVTAPLRVATRLLTGKQSLGRVMARLRAPRAPAPAPRDPAPAQDSTSGRPQPQPVRYPAAGAAAALPELVEGPHPPLPLTVSVVIPTYNAGDEFYWLLRKLKAQQGLAGVEVVVVDSGSSDGTDTLAESFGCTVVRIPNSEFSHSHARNLGADNATGDLLLFTVQDAYPVGDWWLYGLAKALTEPRADGVQLAAVSCSEFPRTDSELIYNVGVDTHYRFLGCRDGDRIGRYIDDGHMSLRVEGQLSDVACMIPRSTFAKYRYQGRYAEDLILGIRLLKDGLRTAMLSSLKVVHSHNRPAAYHLKRTFVDVVFLTEVFPDFPMPQADSAAGAALEAAALSRVADDWRPALGAQAGEELRNFSRAVRLSPVADRADEVVDFGFTPLRAWLEKAVATEKGPRHADAEQLRNMYADRLDHLAAFVERTYGAVDEHLAAELTAAARKTLAATLGAQLSFLYLHQARRGPAGRQAQAEALRTLMTAGI